MFPLFPGVRVKGQVRFLSAVTDENHLLVLKLTMLTDSGRRVRR